MIAVKGMEMPKNCIECLLFDVFNGDYGTCNIIGETKADVTEERAENCPLVGIVTCEHCKHWHDDGIMTTCDKNIGHGFPKDHFCAGGERRE